MVAALHLLPVSEVGRYLLPIVKEARVHLTEARLVLVRLAILFEVWGCAWAVLSR